MSEYYKPVRWTVAEKEEKVLRIIMRAYHGGRLLTFEDIGKAAGFRSKSTVWRYLESLSQKGTLRRLEHGKGAVYIPR